MSDMDQIIRERLVEETVRKLDAHEIVEWIISLEDKIEELREGDE